VETAWDRRLREAPEAKDAIAARARESIQKGETVFLDASSTVFALAHRLQEDPVEDLTIVTTSPAVALGMEAGSARIIVAPGEVDLRMRAIADGWTVEFLRRIKVDGGCYEVYAMNDKGERVEAYFHPVTLAPVPAMAA